MAYIPHSEDERPQRRAAIGIDRLDDLYDAVPESVRFPDLDLPPGVSEMEIMDELQALSEANLDMGHTACFLGAGASTAFTPRLSITYCAGTSSTRPTLRTSPRYLRALCRPSSNNKTRSPNTPPHRRANPPPLSS